MSQRPGSFVNAAGILASDNPAEVVRKLDAAWETDAVESAARRMFEQQADKLAAPWERQWEPTKAHWRARAIEASTPAALDLVDKILNCQPLVHINTSTRLWELLHAAGLSVSDQPEFFRALLSVRNDA